LNIWKLLSIFKLYQNLNGKWDSFKTLGQKYKDISKEVLLTTIQIIRSMTCCTTRIELAIRICKLRKKMHLLSNLCLSGTTKLVGKWQRLRKWRFRCIRAGMELESKRNWQLITLRIFQINKIINTVVSNQQAS